MPPIQGRIRDFAAGPNSAMQRILAEQSTGHLLVVHEKGSETIQELIYIQQGVVLATSSAIQLPVRQILLQHGIVTPEDLVAAEKAASLQNRTDLLPEHFLVHFGKVTMQQVLVTVGSAVKDIVINSLTSDQGLFMFKPADAAAPQRTLARLPWIEVAVAYGRKFDKPEDLIKTLFAPDDIVHLAQDLETLRERVRLIPQEWKILFRVDGATSLAALKAQTPLSPEEFDRAFLACILAKAVGSKPMESRSSFSINTAGAAAPSPAIPVVPAKPKKRVLIIDDSLTIQEMVKEALTPLDLNMETADDGYEGISRAQDNVPDLVILDVMMPGIDGYKTCSSLRKQFGSRKVPIIMLTAKDGTFSLIKGKMYGATDYMTKPFDPKELRDAVAGHL
jgi:CheY-like chemotaxis protein